MTQSIVVQVGQCGNQIGCRFWDLALREHASTNKNGLFDESLNSFFRNVDTRYKNPVDIPLGNAKQKIKSLKARTAGLKDELLFKIFMAYYIGGGTGSGLGTSVLNLLADEYPDVYRFTTAVFPSADDDVITSPYNSVLAMHQLTEFADCVLPIENQALVDICNKVTSALPPSKTGKKVFSSSSHSRVKASSAVTSGEGGVDKGPEKPFDNMNNIAANLILNMTSSARFEGSLNVDLNEITMNLVPFPKIHYLVSSQTPLYSLTDVNLPPRRLDQMFTDAFSKDHQLIKADPKNSLYLACALMLRGNVEISDIRRNIERLKPSLKFIHWNQEGWKTGLSSVPPTNLLECDDNFNLPNPMSSSDSSDSSFFSSFFSSSLASSPPPAAGAPPPPAAGAAAPPAPGLCNTKTIPWSLGAYCAAALRVLAYGNSKVKAKIVGRGGIPPLVELCNPELSSEDTDTEEDAHWRFLAHEQAAAVLRLITFQNLVSGVIQVDRIYSIDLYDTSMDYQDIRITDELIKSRLMWPSMSLNETDSSEDEGKDIRLKDADGRWADIYVTEVIDACHFWAHVGGKPVIEKMEAVNRKLLSQEQTPLDIMPEPGTYVCVTEIVAGHQDSYRAQVLYADDSSICSVAVQVFAVDNGFTRTVSANCLYILPEELLGIPPQATLCCLSGIQPPPKSAEVLEHAAGTLRNLSEDNNSNRLYVAAQEGLEYLIKVDVCQRFVQDEEILLLAVGGIQNLVRASYVNRCRLADSNGLIVLSHIYCASESEAVKTRCLHALRNLVGNYITSLEDCDLGVIKTFQTFDLSSIVDEVMRVQVLGEVVVQRSVRWTQGREKSGFENWRGHCVTLTVPLSISEIKWVRALMKAQQNVEGGGKKFSLAIPDDEGPRNRRCRRRRRRLRRGEVEPKPTPVALSPDSLKRSSTGESEGFSDYDNSTSYEDTDGDTDGEKLVTSQQVTSSGDNTDVDKEKYYIQGYHVPFSEDDLHDIRPQTNINNVSIRPVARSLCAFLNSDRCGTVYLGIRKDGIVAGLRINRKQRDQLRLGVDDIMDRVHPSVKHHSYQVDFVPVVRQRGSDRPSSRAQVEDRFVVEIKIVNCPGLIYTTPTGKCFFRQKNRNEEFTTQEVRERTIKEQEDLFNSEMQSLRMELEEMKRKLNEKAVFFQLQVDLAIGYYPLVPSDSVGMFLFFMFITNVMLPASLPLCAAMSLLVAVGHITITSIRATQNREYFGRQMGANILLFVCSNIIGAIDFYIADKRQRRSVLETRQSLEVKIALESENRQQRRLLHSVLPKHVATEMVNDLEHDGTFLKDGAFNKLFLKRHQECSILFADIVGFTELSSKCTAEELIITLNELFANFDKIGTKNSCQRIKILGDCYYCIAGLDDNKKHAQCAVEMGRDMISHIAKVRRQTGVKTLDMRVGVHTGSVLAGVLGKIKWQFDAWSNDVTLANSMESGGIPGRVHISESTYNCVKLDYDVEPGEGHTRNDFIKEQGVKTFLIVRRKSEDGNKPASSQSQESVDAMWLTDPSSKEKRRTSSPIVELITGDKEHIINRKEMEFRRVSLFDEEESEKSDSSTTTSVKEKMNPFTLRFLESDCEFQYTLEKQEMSGESLFCLCIVIVFCFFVELAILPRSLRNYLTFSLGFLFLAIPTVITAAVSFPKCFPRFLVDLSKILDGSKPARTLIAALSVSVLAGTELIDMLACTATKLDETKDELRINRSEYLNPSSPSCEYPQEIYDNYDAYVHPVNTNTSFVPKKYFSSVIMVLCFCILALHSRQAFEKKTEVEKIRERNQKLVNNILPEHVADYFLQHQNKDETDLYSQSYKYVTVMFASIPNFDEFYSEDQINDGGKECIRFLNEIINDFDEVLSEARFRTIEKIKTIKSTYMAAAGLKPECESQYSENWEQVVSVVDFALALKDKLDSINAECFNQFVLRVGICQGPVVAGVIGAKKPH
ncbi:Adenylate cyclase type 6 [Stylophora pistillata]|uniref:adenylate cyclase n=1 Tax=Stylophora pistillata TaxID=50429 RepID=A0A2B4RD21_STYPI|nr:Adenylate cyclase type 6 [Stylophora pistillata]